MAIKRFVASKDTTITNAFKQNLTFRATASNMGASDVLEVFSIYAQAGTASAEASRVLVGFPTTEIYQSRSAGDIPNSGSVSWYLRLYNADHSETVPSDFTLVASAVSQSWDEGYGLDMEEYSDKGLGVGGYGATWTARTTGSVSNGSMHLNGSDEYVSVTDHSDFNFGDGSDDSPFSISAWIYVDDLSAERPIISKWGSSKREWYLSVTTAGKIYFKISDNSTGAVCERQTAASAISTGTWYHVVATYDGDETRGTTSDCAAAGTECVNNNGLKVYIDGTLTTGGTANSSTSYVAMEDKSNTIDIGRRYDNSGADSQFFDGIVDEVSVWNVQLTVDNASDLYNSGCPTDLRYHSAYKSNNSNLIAWWRFETSDVPIADTAVASAVNGIRDHSDNTHHGVPTSTDGNELVAVAASGSSTTCTGSIMYWSDAGGTYITGSDYVFKQTYSEGTENLEMDISFVVEEWLKYEGDTTTGMRNDGVGIFLSSSQESAARSYYTKKFFARGSEFFFKRPVLEARWNNSKKDNAGNFYLSSSLMTAADNLNKIYFYNVVRGQLKNIPDVYSDGTTTGSIFVSLYSGTSDNTGPTGNKLFLPAGGDVTTAADTNITGGHVEKGIYSASFAYVSSTITTFFPVWHTNSLIDQSVIEYHTGSAIDVIKYDAYDYNPKPTYLSKITNLRSIYSTKDVARFRVYAREKDWSPTIYSVASKEIQTSIVENAYFKVVRVVDDYEIIGYGTGSDNHTLLSYDASGSYFDLDIKLLQKDYAYGVRLLYKINGEYVEQPEIFKFRVE